MKAKPIIRPCPECGRDYEYRRASGRLFKLCEHCRKPNCVNLLLARRVIKTKIPKKKEYRMTKNVKIEDGKVIVSGKYGIDIDYLLPLLLNNEEKKD